MSSSPANQKAAARQFVEFWRGKGYEKGQTQPLWLHLLRVLGVETPEGAIEFGDKSHFGAAYGFSTKMTESERVAELFKRYKTLVAAEKEMKV